uniref:AzlC family ABC transporter permease n=1 Tax=Turicimonas muris TaxID=1796652 RepID=UPI00402AAA79
MTEIKTNDFRWDLTTSIPVFMGYIPLGVVFGFLFVQAGGPWYWAPILSLLIYGGAVQYMMIPMLAENMPISAIAFATFVVNLRHVFYGLSLIDVVPKKRIF